MRIICGLSHLQKQVKTAINMLGPVWITVIMLSLCPQHASAFHVDMNVADGNGGKIVGSESSAGCTQNCTLQIYSKKLVSLFAVADEGYRFAGWNGGCENHLGPLCTLILKENVKVGARFVKTRSISPPSQAILLLHDVNEYQTVWNEYIDQRFNNHCPVIYGGVLMEKDSVEPHIKTHCYRISFGYYKFLQQELAAKGILASRSARDNRENPLPPKYLGNEIRAAILGIMNRQPKLLLTLVSHGKATQAAQSFLQSGNEEKNAVSGLLALTAPGDFGKAANDGLLQLNKESAPGHLDFINIEANPKQGRKINAALASLTDTPWPVH